MTTPRPPIEPVTGATERLAVPGHLLSGSTAEHYVLRVVGESMVEEGIYDGDYVVVLRGEEIVPGDLVVCLVGDDATMKRYWPEGDVIRLQPANSAMHPIYVKPEDFEVRGVVVGLMRKYARGLPLSSERKP